MKFRAAKREPVQVNLTPLIDVVFLLLIFFMVSTTFTKESQLRIELPEAQAEQVLDAPEQMVLVINADGSYALDGQVLATRTMENLLRALELSLEQTPDPMLVISADANASHQSVVRAMDAAGRLGIVNLRIATQDPKPED